MIMDRNKELMIVTIPFEPIRSYMKLEMRDKQIQNSDKNIRITDAEIT